MSAARQLTEEYQVERSFVRSTQGKNKKTNPVYGNLCIVCVVFFALITGLMLTTTQAYLNQQADKVNQLKLDNNKMQNYNDHLKLEIAKLKSLSRIEKIARTELGMVSPGICSIKYLAVDSPEGTNLAESSQSGSEEKKAEAQINEELKINPVIMTISKIVSDYFIGS